MKKVLYRHGNTTFLKAVTDEATINTARLSINNNRQYNFSNKEIGIWQSHLYALQNTNFNYTIILEDDVIFSPDYTNTVNNIIQFTDGWDIVYLGHCFEAEELNLVNKTLGLYQSLHPHCTHGYLVSRTGKEKITQMWQHIDYPIDNLLAESIQRKDLKSLSLQPPIVWQNWQI